MLFNPEKTSFLRPTSLLFELLVLQEMQKNGFQTSRRSSFRELATTMVQAYLTRFEEEGWAHVVQEEGQRVHRITPEGEQRLRLLMVDYVQELVSLHSEAVDIFRKRLAAFYLSGARKVAFYPIGETAEVVFRALEGTGLTLVAAIDDDPSRWRADFHDVPIQGPRTIADSKADAVIVTTCAFQQDIARKIEALGLRGVTVLSL